MENKFKRTTVTSALPYANGPVHIGHLAGVYVPADIYVRYLRLKKEDVLFIGGSDEHGVPITIRAKKEGITPQDVVDRYHTLIKESFKEFGISFDIYSRTTSKTHHELASEFFKTLYDKGEFIEKTSMQYYDEEAHQFLADRYITGECPHCHAEGAYGDQCEKCGTSLSPTDLINPKSAISGSKPVMRETIHKVLFPQRLLQEQGFPNPSHGLPHGVASPYPTSFYIVRIHWGAILYDFQESIHAAILRVCPMADTNVWFHASLVGYGLATPCGKP